MSTRQSRLRTDNPKGALRVVDILPPEVQAILLGAMANALTGLAALGWRQLQSVRGRRERVCQILAEHSSVVARLQASLVGLLSNPEFAQAELATGIRKLLLSPDAEVLLRQLFSWQIQIGQHDVREDVLLDEFTRSLALYSGRKPKDVHELARALFGAIRDAAYQMLTFATEKNILAAHEALSRYRHRTLMREVEGIAENVALLSRASVGTDFPSLRGVEETLRGQIAQRHQKLRPPHLEHAESVHIDRLYVLPDLEELRGETAERIGIGDLLSVLHRAVVLGQPGGGKSSLVQKITHDLVTGQAKLVGRQVTALPVVLRDYGSWKLEQTGSITDFMRSRANSHYQIDAPVDFMPYLFMSGRALVIFDGLDELLDTSYRQEITADIESFCNLYKTVPVLVTSREVGYDQAPLDEDEFRGFRLSPFDEGQVAEYSRKWFGLDLERMDDENARRSDAFILESRIAPDLRTNPLLLGLMCNLYSGENYIPRHRPDVYEACSKMLLEKWDVSRGIELRMPLRSHMMSTIAFMAYQIYCSRKLQGGLTHKNLVRMLAEHLHGKRLNDMDEATAVAESFADSCRGRAWVLSDTGTTAEGESLYQFTHRTFLEYFTAVHLVRSNESSDALLKTLLPHIGQAEWDVVSQLSLQMRSAQSDTAADSIMTKLSTNVRSVELASTRTALFLARCLEFILPSPGVSRRCAEACIGHGLDSLAARSVPMVDLRQLLTLLMCADTESIPAVAQGCASVLSARLRSVDREVQARALEVLLWLPSLANVAGRMYGADETRRVFSQLVRDVRAGHGESIRRLLRDDLSCGIWAHAHGQWSLRSLLAAHGPRAALVPVAHRAGPSNPVATACLWAVLRLCAGGSSKYASWLDVIGESMLRAELPWFAATSTASRIAETAHRGMVGFDPKPKHAWEGSHLFAAVCMYCAYSELLERPPARLPDYVPEPLASLYRAVVSARTADTRRSSTALLERWSLSAAQQELLWRWMRGEVSFCEAADDEEEPSSGDLTPHGWGQH